MLKNVIPPGETRFDEERWKNEILIGLVPTDQLWGYMIRASEEMADIDKRAVNDPVLLRLIDMGIYDWAHDGHSVRFLRHATAIATRLLPRLLDLERKVGRNTS